MDSPGLSCLSFLQLARAPSTEFMGVPHFEEVKWQAPGHLEGETEEELLARRDEQAVAICKTLLDSWSSGAKASVEVITGGITNALFKVTNAELPAESAQKAVILRVFGDNTDLLIDRKKELSVLLQLNKHDFGAKVLTTFSNGRIEEYLTSVAMDFNQCVQDKYISKIARLTAKFHAMDIEAPREPNMWSTLAKWLETARGLVFEDEAMRRAHGAIDFELMTAEIEALTRMCEKISPKVVWVHSDLLPGNIMLDAPRAAMTFIDFEYSTYGYQGFDLGNHWNECMGLECNIDLYPPVEKRRLFVEEYLRGWSGDGEAETKGQGAAKGEVDRLLLESEYFVLVSHVWWGVWAIIQARYSKIDFNYFEYFEKRWKYYLDLKPKTFAELEVSFPW